MEYMIMPLRRYADFSGRSRRREYWLFQLLNLLVIISLVALAGLVSTPGPEGDWISEGPSALLGILAGGYMLAIIIPMLAVQVRRLHDLDMSGWNILWGCIPYLGGFIMLYFMLARGTHGENRYGPDPRFPDMDTVFD